MDETTTTDNGFRSRCCYAPIRMGRKKIKKTNTTVPIWICCNCGRRDVAITPNSPDLAKREDFASEVDE